MILAAAALLSIGSTALAFDTTKLGQGGSLSFDDIMPLVQKTPKLAAEVRAELSTIGKKAEEVMCEGERFPGSWEHLGGERVSPYKCTFGDRELTIKARVRLTDRKGRSYETITKAAMRNAEKVLQDRLTWTWAQATPEKK